MLYLGLIIHEGGGVVSSMGPGEREREFDALVGRAQACQRCPRMVGRRRVMGPLNGNIYAAVMFVAEAPGRWGAEASGIPLHGDASGRNFAALLANIGWRREQVFITNAALCNPRDPHGRNASPTRRELDNCADFLRATIDLVQPLVIVTLGAVALRALCRIEAHPLSLSHDVATATRWYGRTLFPLYHPSPRAFIKRPYAAQLADYARLAAMVEEISRGR